ncbi:hypothetical protein CHCC20494_0674 [Bacillus licheniformis]|nr:hypothetical protein CHCC20494_0674 [Bacillus licheniformis]
MLFLAQKTKQNPEGEQEKNLTHPHLFNISLLISFMVRIINK